MTAPPSVRLDVWLDVACLFRTRSEAQKACRLGRVTVNSTIAKPHREVRVGDQLTIVRPPGRGQTLVVRGLASTHVPKAEARQLYEDLTPPPTSEEVEMRRLERVHRAMARTDGRPSRDERRTRRRLSGKD